jgi:hypothetical protein
MTETKSGSLHNSIQRLIELKTRSKSKKTKNNSITATQTPTVEADVLAHYASKCLGTKITNALSCILGLNKKETSDEKYRRILIGIILGLVLIVTAAYATFVFFVYVYPDPSNYMYLFVFLNKVVLFGVYIIILLLYFTIRTKKPVERIWYVIVCGCLLEEINVAHLVGDKGILSSCNIGLLSLLVVVTLFAIVKDWLRIAIISVIALNLVGLFTYDFINLERHLPSLIEFLEESFMLNTCIVWFNVLLPTVIFVILFYVKIVTQTKYLQSVVKQQEEKLEDLQKEEEEARKILATLELVVEDQIQMSIKLNGREFL